jgi:hypothetical protein
VREYNSHLFSITSQIVWLLLQEHLHIKKAMGRQELSPRISYAFLRGVVTLLLEAFTYGDMFHSKEEALNGYKRRPNDD